MKECKYAKHYKGKIKPKCNDGNGCDKCNEIWEKNQGQITEEMSEDWHYIQQMYHIAIFGA